MVEFEQEELQLDKYGVRWNTQSQKNCPENKDLNKQYSICREVKQSMQRLFEAADATLSRMTPQEQQQSGFNPQEVSRVYSERYKSWRYEERFPGANPISFTEEHMFSIQARETIVCEKTDGVRYFLIEIMHFNTLVWFLVDRNYTFNQVTLTHDMAKVSPAKYVQQPTRARVNGNTGRGVYVRNIFDGELVNDQAWRGREHKEPIFLIFDALLVDGKNLLTLPFQYRLQNADYYVKRRVSVARILQQKGKIPNDPEAAGPPKVDLFMKEMFNIWDAHAIFDHVMDKLQHENDGLIFTIKGAPYYPGTCQHIFKWKPAHLNSIDFNLEPLLPQIPHLPNTWKLVCFDGVLFDYICFDEADQVKYSRLYKEYQTKFGKPAKVVLECFYDRNYSGGAKLNYLHQMHGDQEAGQVEKASKLLTIISQADKLSTLPDEASAEFNGGWKVLRHRTDKNSNPSVVALNILQTIQMEDLEDPLKDLLSDIKPHDFQEQKVGAKRTRQESLHESQQDYEDMGIDL